MVLPALIAEKRDAILSLAVRHGAADVRIFGSFARGEARADSDVDFLVRAGERTSPWFPSGLILDLEQLLGRRVDKSHRARPESASASQSPGRGGAAVKSERLYLEHILSCIDRVRRAATASRQR